MAGKGGGFAPREGSILSGAEQLQRDLDSGRLFGPAVRTILERYTRFVVRKTQQRAGESRYQGHTRRSYTSEVDSAEFPQWGKAGSNLPTAEFMEHGTGLLSDSPRSSGTRHWPPAAALEEWAAKKQIPKRNEAGEVIGILDGADVAKIIGTRGGLAPRRWLRDSAEEADGRVPGWLQQAASEIEKGPGAHV